MIMKLEDALEKAVVLPLDAHGCSVGRPDIIEAIKCHAYRNILPVVTALRRALKKDDPPIGDEYLDLVATLMEAEEVEAPE